MSLFPCRVKKEWKITGNSYYIHTSEIRSRKHIRDSNQVGVYLKLSQLRLRNQNRAPNESMSTTVNQVHQPCRHAQIGGGCSVSHISDHIICIVTN